MDNIKINIINGMYFVSKCGASKEIKPKDKCKEIRDTKGYKNIYQLNDPKHGYNYFMTTDNIDKYYNWIKQTGNNNHLFEIISNNSRMYLDIEWAPLGLQDLYSNTNKIQNKDVQMLELKYKIQDEGFGMIHKYIDYSCHVSFLQTVLKLIQYIFIKYYYMDLGQGKTPIFIDLHNDFKVLDSSNSEKHSFHIQLKKKINGKELLFQTNQKLVQAQDNILSTYDVCEQMIKIIPSLNGPIDSCVYSKERAFRTIGATKFKSDRVLRPINIRSLFEQNKIEYLQLDEVNIYDYYVNPVQNTQFIHIKSRQIQQKQDNEYGLKLIKIKALEYLDESGSDEERYNNPQSNHQIEKKTYEQYDQQEQFKFQSYQQKQTFIKNLELRIQQSIHPSAQYYSSIDQKNDVMFYFIYKDKSEPCFTQNIHKNNNFYAIINKQFVQLKCFSSKCKISHILCSVDDLL